MSLLDSAEGQGGSSTSSPAYRVSWWIVLLFVVLALLRGVIYAAVIPPWQSPDEHGHFEYAWLVSQHGPLVGPEAISLDFQRQVLESMRRFDYWRLVQQPEPDGLLAGFKDPASSWLARSGPQVGDERPLYYWLVGGVLWLSGDRAPLTGMYVGRGVSILLFAAAVGLVALMARSLFPQSIFMQLVSPTLVLFLPMLGEMGAAVNSDAMGVLTGTLFFASLVPVFRDGLSWRRVGLTLTALVLALLSKKTTLFLLPTAAVALPVYGWTRGMRVSRRARRGLGLGAGVLVVVLVALALIPGDDAAGWTKRVAGCGPSRTGEGGFEGEAALRVGACTDNAVTQGLLPEAVDEVAGQSVSLNGWARSVSGSAVGQASIRDSEGHSQVEVTADEAWESFSITHTVDASARWVAAQLSWGETGGPLLFDGLTLSDEGGRDLLVNGSAERRDNLLLDVLSAITVRIGGPRRFIERILDPRSWGLSAWRGYARGAFFCFRSFWGNFGWLAIPLPSTWYWVIGMVCLLALVGNAVFLVGIGRDWRNGYILALMVGVLILAFQTMLPLVGASGSYWLPQGRYLFSAIFALALLLAWGIRRVLPRRWERGAAVVAVLMMGGFDWLCLMLVIAPYYFS